MAGATPADNPKNTNGAEERKSTQEKTKKAGGKRSQKTEKMKPGTAITAR